LPAHFLAAFHETNLSTAKEPTKYALNRVLLRGKSGDIVGSDSRQMLIHGGFRFPFSDNLVVSRTAVFGMPPFAEMDKPAVGVTASHVMIRLENWIFALSIHTNDRFPDIDALMPRPSAMATRFQLDAEDAEFFVRVLAKRIKVGGANDVQLTLDLTEAPTFRFKFPNERVTELSLPRSKASGKAVRINLNLTQFLRAVELRFQHFEIRDAKTMIVAREGDRTFLAMPLTADAVLPPDADAVRLCPTEILAQATPHEPVEPAPVVQPSESELSALEAPTPSRALVHAVALAEPTKTLVISDSALAPVPFGDGEPGDVIAEAEAFASAVMRAAVHAGRLLSILRGVYAQPNFKDVVRNSLRFLTDRSPQEKVNP
jgi:hypothetical protein